ncbi:MAG: 2OG-Fe(II) oxygenase [Bacteroidota bacterium]
MSTTNGSVGSLVDLTTWQQQLPRLKERYQAGHPYPHIVLDNFLSTDVADLALAAFPSLNDSGWINYVHVNENKRGLNKVELLPDYLRQLILDFNKPEFVAFLSELTGIPNLQADETLEGGGLHQSPREGYLNVHADFTVHPHKRTWKRRVNLLLYLNKDWLVEYNGDLELWARDMSRCEQKIAPIFNRVVVFNTDEDSYHGLPEPIKCPPGETRKSLALYFFTIEETAPKLRTTHYRARPDDGWRKWLIIADRQLIAIYTRIKRTLGLNDDFASKLLGFFNRKKKH